MDSQRTRRRQQKRHKKVVQHAQVDGQCVWNALLAGIEGLDANEVTTHAGLLRVIRNRFAKRSSSSVPICVRWQGSSLAQQEIEECQTAIAQQITIRDGYFCSACDPLLVAYVVAFRVNVSHICCDHTFNFEIDNATRHVQLRSSIGHMEHVSNCDMSNQTNQISQQRPSRKVPARLKKALAKSSHVVDDDGKTVEDLTRITGNTASQQLDWNSAEDPEGSDECDEARGLTEEQEKDQLLQGCVHTTRRRHRRAQDDYQPRSILPL